MKTRSHPVPSRGGGWKLQYDALYRAWARGWGVTRDETPETLGFRVALSWRRPLGEG